MANRVERADLALSNDRHDKVYAVQLVQTPEGWTVPFQYGPRNGTQKAGLKTTPTDYETAKKIYDRVVREQTTKPCDCCGDVYVPTRGNGAVLVAPPKGSAPGARRTPVIQPTSEFVLEELTPIDIDEVGKYVIDDNYEMEKKWDGERRPLGYKRGRGCFAMTKLGKPREVDGNLAIDLRYIADTRKLDSFQLDGEQIGKAYIAFDLHELDGVDMRKKNLMTRKAALYSLLRGLNLRCIRISDSWGTANSKRKELLRLAENRAEGAVFKRKNAPYPCNDNVKFKMVETGSFLVVEKQDKSKKDRDSFGVALMDDRGNWQYMGSVTGRPVPGLKAIPGRKPVPPLGSIVEVRYLYVGSGGHLYQPVLLALRDDVPRKNLTMKYQRLKYKEEQ